MITPRTRVFVSYAHDDEFHAERVRALVARLLENGFNARVDAMEVAPIMGWPQWMQNELRAADRIVVVCSRAYRERMEGRSPPGVGLGAAFESRIIQQELYEAGGRSHRVIPVYFDGDDRMAIVPDSLRSYQAHAIPLEEERLYRNLTDTAEYAFPEVGTVPDLTPKPVAGTSPAVVATVAGPSGTAGHVVDALPPRVAEPSRSILITPPPHLRFPTKSALLKATSLPLVPHELRDSAWMPLVGIEPPTKVLAGVGWREYVPNDPMIDRVFAIGFDGTVQFSARLWEAARPQLAWGSQGVDLGTTLDAIIATISLAAKVWTGALGTARVHIELAGVRGRFLAYGSENIQRVYLPSIGRANQDVVSCEFDVPTIWTPDAVRQGIERVLDDYEFAFGSVDRAYVGRRVERALALLATK